ncbi:MAG: hypothetical protein ACOYO1_09925 [Bacteroidales bacterium]
MNKKNDNSKATDPHSTIGEIEEVKAYPLYPSKDDIFNKFHEEKDINPEDIADSNTYNSKNFTKKGKNYKEDIYGSDLDVPGSELDDEQEDIGNEDEENNYYSIGGDAHNDLDES